MKHLLALLLLASLLAIGCAGDLSRPPQKLDELNHGSAQQMNRRTIVLHNVRRVASNQLSARERIESLAVVERLDGPEMETAPALAAAAADGQAPPEVRQEVLAFLARRHYEGADEQMMATLTSTTDPRMRANIMDWLQANARPEMLDPIVRLWAASRTNDQEEARYRAVLQRITDKSWDQALLENCLNEKDFKPKGSALEILAARIPQTHLVRRVTALTPYTDAVLAMKWLGDRFGCVPATRQELASAVAIVQGDSDRLGRAARLAQQWQPQGYQFNVRDYHVLSALASDPLRNARLSRQQVELEVSRSIAARRGGPAQGDRLRRRNRVVDFDRQVKLLRMADLWNLVLLGEMINRPRVQQAILHTAQQDRADRQSASGGLALYENGLADMSLYPPGARRGDELFVPSDRMIDQSADCVCFFVGHFARPENLAESGPSDGELSFARQYNVCGLILTALDTGKFNAVYVNPEGTVIDLGDFSPR